MTAHIQLVEGADEDRQRKLLRQLRDLDDDLEAGKLTPHDHARLREPLEREAALTLHDAGQQTRGPQRGERHASAGTARAHRAAAAKPDPDTPAKSADRTHRRRTTLLVLVLAAGAAAVAMLLANAAAPRQAGQTVSGNAPGVGAPAPASSLAAPAAPSGSASQTITPQQAEAIASAAVQVKAHPKDVNAHLTLAHAYADGGATQLAAVEYLAITRLDPTNAEANTALALLAFDVGQAAQAKQLTDTALAAHPNYPEAHYVRALIELMGLHQATAATQDLNTYLALAPFGSHRTAADTLLALAGSQPTGAASAQPSVRPAGPTVKQGHK